jgi:hypothetical protein
VNASYATRKLDCPHGRLPTLKWMMRHASTVTTETYYVHLGAADVAKVLRLKFGGQKPVADAGLQQSSNMPPPLKVGRGKRRKSFGIN